MDREVRKLKIKDHINVVYINYFTTTRDIYKPFLNIFLFNVVRRLYKTLLKLHRGLPPDLAYMGDMYVKDEFKRHKLATPEQTVTFMESWAVS